MRYLRRLWREERGQELIEYVLLVMLISLTALAAVKTLGKIK
jgi:Flp pilus assembly pilin Flp